MTDKVQKIREEVERLKRWNDNVRNSTRHMTLQEEDFNRGKHSSYIEILDFIDSLQEEPVNKDLEKAATELSCIYAGKEGEGSPYPKRDKFAFYIGFKNGANWQREQMMKDAVEVPIEEAVPFGSCKWKLCAKLWLDKGVKGNKVKLIIIKED